MSWLSKVRLVGEIGLFTYVMAVGTFLIVLRISPSISLFPWEFIGRHVVFTFLEELQQWIVFLIAFVLPALAFSLSRLRALSIHDQR